MQVVWIFGPVVLLAPYDDIEQVFDLVNAGPYGLQAGIYTRSLPLAMQAVRALRMGGVIVNGTSTWRSDQAPYGGVKASGIGREGGVWSFDFYADVKNTVYAPAGWKE